MIDNESASYDDIYEVPQPGYWAGQLLVLAIILVLLFGMGLSYSIHDNSTKSTIIIFGILVVICLAVEVMIWAKRNRRVAYDFKGIYDLLGKRPKEFISWGEVAYLHEHYTKEAYLLQDLTRKKTIEISRKLKFYDGLLNEISKRCGKNLRLPEFPIRLSSKTTYILGTLAWYGIILLTLTLVFSDQEIRLDQWRVVFFLAVVLVGLYPFLVGRVFALTVNDNEAAVRTAFRRKVLVREDISKFNVKYDSNRGNFKKYYLAMTTKSGDTYHLYENLAPISELREIFQKFLADRYFES